MLAGRFWLKTHCASSTGSPLTAGEPDKLGYTAGTPAPFSRWQGTQFCAYRVAPRSAAASLPAPAPEFACCEQAQTAVSNPNVKAPRRNSRILSPPGAEGTCVQMHEIRRTIEPHSSAPQLLGLGSQILAIHAAQAHIDGAALHVQAVLRHAAAALVQTLIGLRRSISGNHIVGGRHV